MKAPVRHYLLDPEQAAGIANADTGLETRPAPYCVRRSEFSRIRWERRRVRLAIATMAACSIGLPVAAVCLVVVRVWGL